MHPNKWVKVHTIESIFEMDIIKDALEKEGIEYSIKEYKDTAYDGHFVLQKGYAALFVKEKDMETVTEIINHFKSLPYVAFSKD
jgi:ketol-acid reductoisomerase